MSTTTKMNQRGFTLIELLAVMAIVAVLAGIVSVAVGGTGETSKDTQTKQEATTMETAAADYFSDQEGAEVLTPKTVDVLGTIDIVQGTSSRWPEQYITDAYPQAFPDEGVGDPTVNFMFLLTSEDGLSSISTRDLLENFNAIDFSLLVAGDYLAVEPDGATQLTADRYSNYLWLFKKTTASGGSSEGAARQVAVFKLLSVQEFADSGLVDLTYLQLVGESPDGAAAVNNAPVAIPDSGTVFEGGAVNNGDGTVTYTHDGSETTSDSFTYTVNDNEGATSNEATVSITVTPVNDLPLAINDSGTATQGGFVIIDLTVNDTDAEGTVDDATIVLSVPSNGGGTVTYTHDGTTTTSDSFTYTVNDNEGATSNVATVNITIS